MASDSRSTVSSWHGGPEPQARVPGVGLPGVFDLRYAATPADPGGGDSGARVVCVGMGFIGAEVAASLRTVGCDVTVVEVFETTLYRILGPEIGRALEGIHRDQGCACCSATRSNGSRATEARARRHRGRVAIDADVAIVGVGTEPAVEIMAGTGLDQRRRDPGRADAGDEGPRCLRRGRRRAARPPGVRADPRRALRQRREDGGARRANMLGSDDVFDDPHWFWSDQYDSKVEMAGFAPTWDRMVVRGSLEDRSFCAFLLDDGRGVRSTVSLDWQRDVRRSFGLIEAQCGPDPAAAGGSRCGPPHVGRPVRDDRGMRPDPVVGHPTATSTCSDGSGRHAGTWWPVPSAEGRRSDRSSTGCCGARPRNLRCTWTPTPSAITATTSGSPPLLGDRRGSLGRTSRW